MYSEGYQCAFKNGFVHKDWKNRHAISNSGFLWGELGDIELVGEFILCCKFFCIVCNMHQFHLLAIGGSTLEVIGCPLYLMAKHLSEESLHTSNQI